MLTVEGLCRRFDGREIVRSLDLAVEVGGRVALCGPNGSGKSTILRCAAGTLAPSAGRIRIGGHDAGTLSARRLVGVSFAQERSFYLRLSGYDNLLFCARLRGATPREAARSVAALGEELELGRILATRADRCSTGMIQQLAFARALLGDPPLLLLDEPSRSLDREAFGRLWAALDRRPAAAVLIATQLDADVARCERRVELQPLSGAAGGSLT